MQLKQSSVDVSDLVPVLTADGNKRVAEFRNRKASTGKERMELYTTKLVKEQVRQFAKLNAVTRGVAAEILLRRGIDAHILETRSVSDAGGLEGSAREEFAADVCPEPDTSDSMPSWARHIRDARVKTDDPQQVPVQALVSGSLFNASTRPALEPADSKSLPEVVGSPERLMPSLIRDHLSPKLKHELANYRWKKKTKG